jgi:hypothetical protein
MPSDVSVGRPIPTWERLLDAMSRVKSAGIAQDDAKRGICDGIADGRIKIRLTLRKHATKPITAGGKVLDGADVEIPPRLDPQQMDFENSRPQQLWVVKQERIRHLRGYWEIEWIEVFSDDITEQLIPAGDRTHPSRAQGPQESVPRPRRRSQTGREAAARAIVALYGDRVPDQATEPNATLCRRVSQKLQELGLLAVSDDTMLRAASRRRN